MITVSSEAVTRIWMITLVIYAVVVVVVATLLTLIVVTARRIRAGVGAIWVGGQRIANNTIHIALLQQTNAAADQILASAVGVIGATAAIKEHAGSCPGCPACVLGKGWRP